MDLTGKGFRARTQAYMRAAAEEAKGWFNAQGDWLTAGKPLETRERFWLACALYGCRKAKFADAVVRRGETARYGDVRFNIFDTNIAAALLVRHGRAMAPDVRAKLESLVRDGFSFKPGNRQPDYQFHGYNDNMPAKATMGLILGGELLDRPDAVEYGLWNLRQLRAMLVRRGINSEFNSPTYSPITLHAIAEVAHHARNEEARELAAGIEARLWMDIAARFHPGMGVVSGPYARAYTIDTIAHVSLMSAMLWFVLGEGVNPSPMEFFRRPEGLVVHHMGDYPFNISQMCWLASGCYHVPAAARRLFESKNYPARAVAQCEQGDAGPDFPGRPCRIESVLYPDFAVGTASTPLCGGEQTMSYFAIYRRRGQVASFRDVGTVFTKLVLDDEVPGTLRQAMQMLPAGAEMHPDGKPAQPLRYENAGEEDCLHSHANTVTLQDGPTALVLTHPHLSLGGACDEGIVRQSAAREISRLSEMVVFPSHFAGCDELIVGGIPRQDWSGDVPDGAWIACRRGRLLIAVRPMAYTRTLGPVRIRLETCNRYQIIRWCFYEGEKRRFSRSELRHVFGGFVAEHAGADEYATLDAFAREVGAARITDYFWTTRRARYHRPAGAVRGALDLELSWSPGSHVPRYATINGRAPDMPVAALDGIPARRMPFLGEPYRPVPEFFPWKDLRVEWGDWPFAIHDRGADDASNERRPS